MKRNYLKKIVPSEPPTTGVSGEPGFLPPAPVPEPHRGSEPLTSEQQFTRTMTAGAFTRGELCSGKRILDLFEPHRVLPVVKVHVVTVHFLRRARTMRTEPRSTSGQSSPRTSSFPNISRTPIPNNPEPEQSRTRTSPEQAIPNYCRTRTRSIPNSEPRTSASPPARSAKFSGIL